MTEIAGDIAEEAISVGGEDAVGRLLDEIDGLTLSANPMSETERTRATILLSVMYMLLFLCLLVFIPLWRKSTSCGGARG